MMTPTPSSPAPLPGHNRSNLPSFGQAEFERFRELLQEKCGMFFDENKLSVMRSVIQERMTALEITEYDAYYKKLNEPAHSQPLEAGSKIQLTGHRMLSREMRRLVEGLAVNETAFFRNREHYRALQEEVLPRLFRRNFRKKKIRIWSAGCSTGQEPYSLAITVLESLKRYGHTPAEWHIEIIATDISERALRTAHTGRYRNDEMRGVDEPYLKQYFEPLSSHSVATAPLEPAEIYKPGRSQLSRPRQRIAYEVSPVIRQLVTVTFFNLVTSVYPFDRFHDFDLVLCENVTIYFPPEITRRVIENLYNVMDDGGFLFIGYSETLWQVSDRFKLINTQDTFYYQKPFPHEEAPLYVRRAPTTGPLSQEALQKLRQPLTPPSGDTDELPNRPQNPGDRQRKTDPLGVRRGSTGQLPVIGNSQPQRIISETSRPTPPSEPRRLAPIIPKPRPPTDQQRVSPPKTEGVYGWYELLAEGQRQMREHNFEPARLSLEAALEAGPTEVEVLNALAELKLKLGDYAAALQLCQKAIKQNQLTEPAHLMLAMIYHKEGQIEKAIEEYKNTIYINMEAVIAYMRLADIYRDMGRQRDALREYRRAASVLQTKTPDEMIEDLSVGLLMQACQQNIAHLTPRNSR